MQVRLRPLKEKWPSDETPKFALDLRNTGKEPIDYSGFAGSDCKIQIDDRWYRWWKPIIPDRPVSRLLSGTTALETEFVTLTNDWEVLSENGPRELLKLDSGRHKVQVAFRMNKFAAISNQVTIKITEEPWGKVTNGLKVRLRALKEKWRKRRDA